MTAADDLQQVLQPVRKYSEWSSRNGLRTDILPWRLWEKAKQLHWDPADIDFTQDAADWAALPLEHQIQVAGLARGFMIGEEGVTLDIVPLMIAMADDGRAEETIFLTSFAYEEAKHVDFFRRWFDAIGADVVALEEQGRERMIAAGQNPPNPERTRGMFESILPKTMRRLLVDRSPKAFLDAGVTYNQFIEGCLAIAGYRVWKAVFDDFGILPGLREGLGHVQRDERRHIAYGTYLCRRLIASDPSLFEFARDRMHYVRDEYFETSPWASPNGSPNSGYGSGEQVMTDFAAVAYRQVDRRIAILDKARQLTPDDAERGVGAEEAEEELEAVG